MREFIDLRGASGNTYRFRLWAEGTLHAPMGGNYAYVRAEGDGYQVVQVAATGDLSQARAGWKQAVTRHRATHVFTRLNVSRSVREAENEDLQAAFPTRSSGKKQPADADN